MKKLLMMALAVTVGLSACKKDDDDNTPANNDVNFGTVTLSGANEVPAVTTTGTGTLKAMYNKTSKKLTYTLTYSGFGTDTVTAAHFHKGAEGVVGPVVVPITLASGTEQSTAALTTEQETDLLNNMWYVNVHTKRFPNGAIRAQLKKQ